jgi:hypothetical protein
MFYLQMSIFFFGRIYHLSSVDSRNTVNKLWIKLWFLWNHPPSVSSCNLSSLSCSFSALFGLPMRFNSCISKGHDSRAASAV